MLPPAALLRMMGIDPAQMKEIEKVVATVDTEAISKFINKLPLLIEAVDRIDRVFMLNAISEESLEDSIAKVYLLPKLENVKVTPVV